MSDEPTTPTEDELMPKQEAAPAPDDEESPLTQADITAEAAALGTTSYEIAGIFREVGKDTLTESEFRAALSAWRGEGG